MKLPPRLLTEPEAATILGMTPAALCKARQRGTGPTFVQLGSRIRYAPADLVAYVNANRKRPKQ